MNFAPTRGNRSRLPRVMSTEFGMMVLEAEFNRVDLGESCGAFFDPVSRVFRLISRKSLYAFRITPRTNLIEHLYWGTRLEESDELSFLALNSVLMKSPFDPTSQVVEESFEEPPAPAEPMDVWKAASREARRLPSGDLSTARSKVAGKRPPREVRVRWRL